ncbi:MAG: M48 family peptidase, partial [Bacteroidales bacterium]|nr:M48 family peptidase [Bacteroidales bacterium]
MRVRIRTLVVLVVSMFLLEACQTVPITGRKQINLLPEATMVEMGFANFDAFMNENQVSSNRSASEMVARTGQKISGAVNQ